MNALIPSMRDLSAWGPNVITGTGGSGTRVVACIAQRGGMFIGTSLGPNNRDALEFRPFFDRWINPFLDRRDGLASPETAMVHDFEDVIARHCAELGPEPRPWGWKAPRSLYLLPFFHDQCPSLKVVHLIRDGRDMAYTTRRRHVKRHGGAVLDRTEMDWSMPLKLMAAWDRLNLEAADYGETHLRDRYLLVRLEDLCADPVPTIRRVFDFFGLDGNAEQIAREEITTPPSLGRWRDQDPETLAELHRVGARALRRFGYLADA